MVNGLGVRDFELSTTLKATVAQPRSALETLPEGALGVYCVMHLT